MSCLFSCNSATHHNKLKQTMFPYSMTMSKFFGKRSSFTFYWCKRVIEAVQTNTDLTLKSCQSCLNRTNSNGGHESHWARLGLHSVLVVSTVWKEDKHHPCFISSAKLYRRHKHLHNLALDASVGKRWRHPIKKRGHYSRLHSK